MHLIIDGFYCNPDLLWDAGALERFLLDFPEQIGMSRITEPSVVTYSGQKPLDAGVSGFVIIAESHISIHTFPHRGYVNVDIFSCKEFDTELAVGKCRSLLGFTSYSVHQLNRGLEWLGVEQGQVETSAQRVDLSNGLTATDEPARSTAEGR